MKICRNPRCLEDVPDHKHLCPSCAAAGRYGAALAALVIFAAHTAVGWPWLATAKSVLGWLFNR